MSLPIHRAEALARYVRPDTKKGLRAFLGSIGFYQRYIKLLASQTAILTPFTSKQAPPRIVWDERSKRAFDEIRSNISQACMLCIPLPQDTFSQVTDASGLGIGGILQVRRNGEWEAAAFFSRQLRGPEHRYSATELEALAVVATVEHFQLLPVRQSVPDLHGSQAACSAHDIRQAQSQAQAPGLQAPALDAGAGVLTGGGQHPS